MRGDFSRILRPTQTASRPLFHQGRPLVDADVNLALAALVDEMRRTASHVIGWHGGPGKLVDDDGRMTGRYYVHGLGVDLDIKTSSLIKGFHYLEIMEIDRNHLELEGLTDPAFEPIVASWRARLEYCIRHVDPVPRGGFLDEEQAFLSKLRRSGRRIEMCPSIVSADSTRATPPVYSGENQLWRVELLDDVEFDDDNTTLPLHLVWSRDNASITYSVAPGSHTNSGALEIVEVAGGDQQPCDLEPGVLVQACSLVPEGCSFGGPVYRIVEVDPDGRTITLDLIHEGSDSPLTDLADCYLRQWEGYSALDLEPEGTEILAFVSPGDRAAELAGAFRWTPPVEGNDDETLVALAGDFWSIPVRHGQPVDEVFTPPDGPTRHIAPLFTRKTSDTGALVAHTKKFDPLSGD